MRSPTIMTDLVVCAFALRFSRSRSTGKERDAESGNDYFGARYYRSSMGRFLSPDYIPDGLDPVAVPWASFENPQSLNLYAYVLNNPLASTDPDGNDCVVQTRTDPNHETVTVSSGNCDNVNVNTDEGQTKTYVAGTVDVSSIQGNGSGGITFNYTTYGGDAGVSSLNGASEPDHPGLAYGWGNNAQGWNNLGTTGATVGSVRGVATFYAASAAGAVCVLYCAEAATVLYG
jgi:RHS repeat-associated protein